MPAFVLYRLNTHRVELVGLEKATGVDARAYVNNASCGITLVDSLTGTEVAGATWPLALAYESGSNGNYSGVTPALNLAHGARLLARITATTGGAEGYWELPVVVRTRAK